MKIVIPKNWKELDIVFKSTLAAYKKIQDTLFSQSKDVLNIVLESEDGSGIIEEVITKHPSFVPNMQELKSICKQLDICQKMINDQSWLEQQPEYYQNQDENGDESGSSSGGSSLSILQLYRMYDMLNNAAVSLNLDLDMIFKLTYDLRHNQTHYVDRQMIQNKVKEIQKSLSQKKEKSQETTQTIDRVKDMSSHSRGAMGRK